MIIDPIGKRKGKLMPKLPGNSFKCVCPKCGKRSWLILDNPEHEVNCGDCLIKRMQVVKMKKEAAK